MVKISIFSPNTPGARFDLHSSLHQHMPLALAKLSASPGFRGVSVERGIAGAQPGSAPTYIALCQYLFDSAEAYVAAFEPHAEVLKADMPNYTDIPVVIQSSAVELTQ